MLVPICLASVWMSTLLLTSWNVAYVWRKQYKVLSCPVFVSTSNPMSSKNFLNVWHKYLVTVPSASLNTGKSSLFASSSSNVKWFMSVQRLWICFRQVMVLAFAITSLCPVFPSTQTAKYFLLFSSNTSMCFQRTFCASVPCLMPVFAKIARSL